MDESYMPDEPEPQPPTGTAAEVFARLAARVEAMDKRFDGRLAVIFRTLENIAVEKQSIEVPDYNPTLGSINGNLADLAKRMKAVEQSEALKLTPESLAERIIVASEAARETDKATIKQAMALHRETHADQLRAIGAIRTKDQQWWHMLYTGIGTALVVSLLWLFYPGWAAGLAPKGWHWPERVATRTMGEPSPWDAGIRLMRTGNPEGWQAIVDAADMARDNRDTIAACERAAAKAKGPVRCMIRFGKPLP
ncbi:hypothetical protein AX777_23435 [Sphingobium yanoikuyae]|uniref:Uncharacterized protein n=1 Tax=Sphingobium yanoikuyae TaxID=13690 RepID=A0A177JCJ0_SPHYA|nr:DUF6118 family protein [Sphingobium yanoikuyae]OAH38597.1 hypothetical protein AX777_23435 [Sphingobium yanoikuyae]